MHTTHIQDMAAFFGKALPRLRKVFLYYCRTGRDEDDNAHTMSLREFCQMLVDAGLYVRDRTRRRANDITMKHIRMAFSGVQVRRLVAQPSVAHGLRMGALALDTCAVACALVLRAEREQLAANGGPVAE